MSPLSSGNGASPAGAELCSVTVLPGTGRAWTPALLGRAGLRAPAHYHGGFYLLCLSRAPASTSSLTRGAAGQHLRGRLCFATTFFTISVNPHLFSVIPNPFSEMRLSCRRGSSGRVLMDADDPVGRGSQHGRRGEGHGLLVHGWNSGACWVLLMMHQASVCYGEAPRSSLKNLVPCLGVPISKVGIFPPPRPGCCKGLNEFLFVCSGLVRTFSKGREVF